MLRLLLHTNIDKAMPYSVDYDVLYGQCLVLCLITVWMSTSPACSLDDDDDEDYMPDAAAVIAVPQNYLIVALWLILLMILPHKNT